MNDEECSRESGVRRAMDKDDWTEDLRQHVSQCASCREAVQVSRFMKGAARAMERAPVPDAREVWSRIQLAERQRLAERAQRPVRLAWLFAKCWFACGAGLVLYRDGSVIGNFLLTMPTYVYIVIAAGVTIFIKGRGLLRSRGT